MRLASKFLHLLLIAALVMPAAPAIAQTQPYQYGVYPNPAATQAAPYEVQPPVQTPVITNNVPAQAPAAGYVQVPGQRPQFVPAQPREALSAPSLAPAPAQQPVPEKNEFQEFIARSTGQTLPLFGYNLFQGAPSTFAPVENVPVTPDYVIGPGDELLIRAWGQIDI
ncbi:MAG TPA: hypothetical protein VKP89_12985, partial [Burkholderiales bacterium]|nr:hypothetical protein [Burkholderiales bacterium]